MRKKLQAELARIAMTEPFYSYILSTLDIIEDPTFPTAWTDGVSIGINPHFFAEITMANRCAVLVHEADHVRLEHPLRMGGRDHEWWNISCDAAINAINPFPLPPGCVPGIPDKNAEWIYNQPRNKSNPRHTYVGKGPGVGEIRKAPKGVTPEKVRQRVQQAAAYARAQGKLPGHIKRDLKLAEEAQVPWQAYVHRFLQELAPTDYSWIRPDPEFVRYGTYVPVLEGTCVGTLAIAVDTSGSIYGEVLSQFGKEVAEAMAVLRPRLTRVIWCDAKVQRVDEYGLDEDFEIGKGCPGGGGTDFRPVFKHIEGWDTPPIGLIFLTDTHGSFPKAPPAYPMLWVIQGGGEVPWGEYARIMNM